MRPTAFWTTRPIPSRCCSSRPLCFADWVRLSMASGSYAHRSSVLAEFLRPDFVTPRCSESPGFAERRRSSKAADTVRALLTINLTFGLDTRGSRVVCCADCGETHACTTSGLTTSLREGVRVFASNEWRLDSVACLRKCRRHHASRIRGISRQRSDQHRCKADHACIRCGARNGRLSRAGDSDGYRSGACIECLSATPRTPQLLRTRILAARV